MDTWVLNLYVISFIFFFFFFCFFVFFSIQNKWVTKTLGGGGGAGGGRGDLIVTVLQSLIVSNLFIAAQSMFRVCFF